VIDEHSSLCLAIRVGRRCKAKDMVAVLEELTSSYPAPRFIRRTSGRSSLPRPYGTGGESTTTKKAYIEPGSPWENGFAESFIGRIRDEFLNTELFTTAPEAQLLADHWRWEYYHIQAILAPPGACAPGGSSTGNCSMTTTSRSDQAWTDEGGSHHWH
jgi:transposase InsO family protein